MHVLTLSVNEGAHCSRKDVFMPTAFSIQTGVVTKHNAGPMTFSFPSPFTTIPLVFLTPTFLGTQITFVDSVISVSASEFTVNSPNHDIVGAGPYTLQWLAIAQE